MGGGPQFFFIKGKGGTLFLLLKEEIFPLERGVRREKYLGHIALTWWGGGEGKEKGPEGSTCSFPEPHQQNERWRGGGKGTLRSSTVFTRERRGNKGGLHFGGGSSCHSRLRKGIGGKTVSSGSRLCRRKKEEGKGGYRRPRHPSSRDVGEKKEDRSLLEEKGGKKAFFESRRQHAGMHEVQGGKEGEGGL